MNETSTPAPRHPRSVPVPQTVALMVGSAISAWWPTYTRPEEVAAAEGLPLSEADYAIDPPTLPTWAETLLGAGAPLITVAMAILILLVASAVTALPALRAR